VPGEFFNPQISPQISLIFSTSAQSAKSADRLPLPGELLKQQAVQMDGLS
jgi:hypothetical protein